MNSGGTPVPLGSLDGWWLTPVLKSPVSLSCPPQGSWRRLRGPVPPDSATAERTANSCGLGGHAASISDSEVPARQTGRMELGWWAWVLVGIGVIAVLALVVTWVPDQLVQHDIRRSTRKRPLSETPTATDRLKARTDARNSLLQSISVLGIAAGLVVTILQVTSTQESAQRQLRVAEAQQERDRFNAAVENLSSPDDRSIRLGGVHTLATLLDSPEFKEAALAVLALYISENAVPGSPGVAVSFKADQPDVEAALREGCRASQATDFGDLVILDGKNLVDMDLSGCDLTRASLREAHGRLGAHRVESQLCRFRGS